MRKFAAIEIHGTMLFAETQDRRLDIPLTDVHIDAVIHDKATIVTLKQHYHNALDKPLEVFYSFPVYPAATVLGCIVKFQDGMIETVLKRKKEATEEYETAKAEGRKATLLGHTREELYDLKLGNVQPKEKIEVSIRYLLPLKKDMQGYKLVFPMAFSPRYDNQTQFETPSALDRFNAGVVIADTPSHNIMRSSGKVNTTIKISGTMLEEVVDVKSLHQFNGDETKELKGRNFIAQYDKVDMSKDFCFIIDTKIDQTNYVLQEKYKDGTSTCQIRLNPSTFVNVGMRTSTKSFM